MKAVHIDAYGGRDRLAYRDVDTPAPGPGEVLVKLDYAGVNFIDVYMREGHYRHTRTYGTPLPFTLGMEGAGTVVDANGAQSVANGDRVAYCLERGSYAECAAVAAAKLVKVPADIDVDVATVLMLQGCTAHYLSHSLYPIRPGEWCLVHAGAGGVGQLLIQLAKARGGRVIATVGTPAKAEIVNKLGADHAVLYREVDFQAAVRDITGGEGVHVVYDSVGRDTIDRSLRCLRRRGTCVNFGGSSGMVETVKPLDLAEAGSVFFTRPHLAHYMASHEEIQGRADDLFEAVRTGKLQISIDTVFRLSEAVKAHETIEARKTMGKLLLDTARP